jgi:carboxypeptidase PM20D1
MKRGLKILALVLSLLLMVLIARTLRVRPAVKAPPLAPLSIDELGAARRFAGALRIPTISHADREKNDPKQFEAMHAYLESQFPRVHAALRREVVNGQSLLYTWSGRDRGARPILLLAHMDVVPVEPGTESKWTHPPFSGEIADGFVWGRGALDDKVRMVGLLEAVDWLLAQGFQPSRTIYLAFGHDEEIGGDQGAAAIAALLKSRGVRAEFSGSSSKPGPNDLATLRPSP